MYAEGSVEFEAIANIAKAAEELGWIIIAVESPDNGEDLAMIGLVHQDFADKVLVSFDYAECACGGSCGGC